MSDASLWYLVGAAIVGGRVWYWGSRDTGGEAAMSLLVFLVAWCAALIWPITIFTSFWRDYAPPKDS